MSRLSLRTWIRHIALTLSKFTFQQMHRGVGEHTSSTEVLSELNILMTEGYLSYNDGIYYLVKDGEKRLELLDTIQDELFPPRPPSTVPTSRHYKLALNVIEEAQTAESEHRKELLQIALDELEFAFHAEGGSLLDTSGPVFEILASTKQKCIAMLEGGTHE
jgi:hypothetical protein